MIEINNNSESSIKKKNYDFSISSRYEAIVIGDAYCGKTSFLLSLAERERELNIPVNVSQDKTEFEFCVETKLKQIWFAVKDTASKLLLFRSLKLLI